MNRSVRSMEHFLFLRSFSIEYDHKEIKWNVETEQICTMNSHEFGAKESHCECCRECYVLLEVIGGLEYKDI